MTKKTQQRIEKLLKLLSDGKFHSGQSIAEKLGVSRTAVWKLIQKIESWQLTVYSIRGRGYQIPGGLELLDQQQLKLSLKNNELFNDVILHASIDSTSNFLAEEWKKSPGYGRVCIAEHQTSGRGRKGRSWVSPFAANLYFSIGVELPLGLSALGGLSLVVGMSICSTLNRFTNDRVKVKWPNDLMVDDHKLAGILVEASGETNDTSFLNIGVGINWDMQNFQGELIDQPWINLKQLLVKSASRQQILTEILCELDAALVDYLTNGFSHFSTKWQGYSAMYQRDVNIMLTNEVVSGKEVGIEANGALRVQTVDGIRLFHSGEVSLRKKMA
ncbi:bifunctional biotin--[acetyl-CoA-carboxylase] ligase/biotin operon repressor BirA [Aliikangiella sp. G2MR2-5]|uniref:bifunctional biotin--[acetyl-CoA-carboxylase] ligase/biotin operon repressor BirA n=1 Tax=Aliikangiella sp. G2MR2-5 TaxID=2788943 RepID=UPI0018A98895|nr:bifunctional biotin--[acetyl-CoA-carboxylase] ligase/biotin operon repressor BirA [Aliikangiella sp. G2MR2-5]